MTSRRTGKVGTGFAALTITAVVFLVGSALATGFEPVLPAQPDPAASNPQITVTPSDNLTDGQVVSVDGRRFGFNSTGVLRQCTKDLLVWGPETPFTSGRNGNFGGHRRPAQHAAELLPERA